MIRRAAIILSAIAVLAILTSSDAMVIGDVSVPHRQCQKINCHVGESRECNACGAPTEIEPGWSPCAPKCTQLDGGYICDGSCAGIQMREVCDTFCVRGRLYRSVPQ